MFLQYKKQVIIAQINKSIQLKQTHIHTYNQHNPQTQPTIKHLNNNKMTQSNLLKTIRLIIKKYSKLPMKQLFQSYLYVNISLCDDEIQFKKFLTCQFPMLSKTKINTYIQSFSNGGGKNVFIYLSINHTLNKYFNLSQCLSARGGSAQSEELSCWGKKYKKKIYLQQQQQQFNNNNSNNNNVIDNCICISTKIKRKNKEQQVDVNVDVDDDNFNNFNHHQNQQKINCCYSIIDNIFGNVEQIILDQIRDQRNLYNDYNNDNDKRIKTVTTTKSSSTTTSNNHQRQRQQRQSITSTSTTTKTTNIIFWQNLNHSKYWLQQLKTKLDLCLSIHQLFHSHLNLIVTLQLSNTYEKLLMERQLFNNSAVFFHDNIQQQQNYFIQNSEYCRFFMDSRASKMTVSDLKEYEGCDIKNYLWGQTITINQGVDGIIIWLLKDTEPTSLKPAEKVDIQSYTKFLKMVQNQQGHAILLKKKSERFPKIKYQQLQLTTIVFNIKKQYIQNYVEILNNYLPFSIKKFSQYKLRQNCEQKYEKNYDLVDRLYELLELDGDSGGNVGGDVQKMKYQTIRMLYHSE